MPENRWKVKNIPQRGHRTRSSKILGTMLKGKQRMSIHLEVRYHKCKV